MSKDDRYFTAPLSILRSGQSAMDVVSACIDCGIMNAGIGYKKANDADAYEKLLSDAAEHAQKKGQPSEPPKKCSLQHADGARMLESEAAELWNCALAGWRLLNVSGGNCLSFVQTWIRHHREREVFFRIKSDWIWSAWTAARRESGMEVQSDFKPISWREFRILAAILSAKLNGHGFAFLGWEMIQARACGFHSKALFNAGKGALPLHCQPLTRQMIRAATDKLEALGFFARSRYAKGERGGLMAYSLRHAKREDLQADVMKWASANASFRTKTANHRAADLKAFRSAK